MQSIIFSHAMNTRFLHSLKIQHLWAITVILGVFIFMNTQPIRPHDFWWHIALGREIASTGQIPEVDSFSYTMQGAPYQGFKMFWLVDLALFGIYSAGGAEMIVFTQSIIITTAYSILMWLCWKICGSWRTAAIAILFAAALGINSWNVRPQTISYLIGVLFILAIYHHRRKPRWIYLLIFPLGMLIWVNSHGSFVIGLVLVGIWLLDEAYQLARRRFGSEPGTNGNSFYYALGAFTLSAVACLVNPRGIGIASYVLNLTGNKIVQGLIPEWAPPSYDTLDGIIFLIGLMGSATILIVSPKRADFFQLLTFLIFGFLGLQTRRGSVWFGIVMAPVLADHLSSISRQSFRKKTQPLERPRAVMVNLVILVLLILAGAISLPWFKEYLPLPPLKAGLISSETPVAGTNFLLEQQPPGELFHDMAFGSYLTWAAPADYRVFVDPRIEFYPLEIWGDYLAIVNALPGWEQLLEAYRVNTLMLDPNEQGKLIERLNLSGEWRSIYQDDSAVLFVRRSK